MAKPTNAEIEAKRAVIAEAREQALQAKAETIRVKAHNKAENIRRKADAKAKRAIAKGEAHAAKIEGIVPAEIERKIRLDVHGRPKPLLRGWIHAIATPLALAAGIVLICLAHGTGLKWACAVFMTCSLVLFGNSACYHLGDWSPRVTDVLRRIDHMNIFLLIAGTYTPVSFALTPFWRDSIIAGMWICTTVALIIHVIWISAPRWLYVLVYIIFGVSGTVTTMTALAMGLTEYDHTAVDGARCTLEDAYAVDNRFLHMPREERLTYKTIHPGRVDVVGGGALVWNRVLAKVSEAAYEDHGQRIDSFMASEHGLLDGIVLDYGKRLLAAR